MAFGFRFFSVLLIALFALAPAPHAAGLKTPSCNALAAFAENYNGKERWRFNSYSKKIWLPAILHEERTTALFGKPILTWTPADAKAAAKAAKTCGQKAKKAKRGKESRQLSYLQISFIQKVGPMLGNLAKREETLGAELAAVLGEAPSRDALRVTAALSRIGPGGAMDPADWGTLTSSVAAPYKTARGIVSALRQLPDAKTEAMRPSVQARYDELRQPVVDDLLKGLQATPETLEGLSGLASALAATRKDLGGALTDTDYAALDAAASARRDTIEITLLESETAKIAAAPEGLTGLAAVNGIISGPVAAALSEPRVLALRQAAIERRRALSDALVEAELAKFEDLPGTLKGLRQFAAVEAAALGRLESQDTGGAITGFRHAVAERKAALGRAAYDDFETVLAALPENETGLKQLGRLDVERKRLLKGSRKSVNRAYDEATAARRAVLAEAVAREEERLAGLPLSGAIFADRHGNRFEFRDRTRVYMTVSSDVTMEGQYEEDGDRVIVRLPQANMVMTRDGSWLKGNGFELKRQPRP